MSTRICVLLGLTAFLTLGGCASRSLRLVNPQDESPRLSAHQEGVSVSGGGSGSSRGWDRRIILSLTLHNARDKTLKLKRKDLVMQLGLRRVSAHQLIGSEESGPVEGIRVPPHVKVDFIAQFSTAFAIRKTGKIVLRLYEEGSKEPIALEVPIRLKRPPDILKAPGMIDRADKAPADANRGS